MVREQYVRILSDLIPVDHFSDLIPLTQSDSVILTRISV